MEKNDLQLECHELRAGMARIRNAVKNLLNGNSSLIESTKALEKALEAAPEVNIRHIQAEGMRILANNEASNGQSKGWIWSAASRHELGKAPIQ